MRLPAVLFAAFVAAAQVLPAQSRPDAQAFAQRLQARYQSVRDFTGDFVQTYRGGVLRTQTQERGTVTIKKPGRMRWVYTAPERKEFVSDGIKVYAYIPQDRQVVVSTVSPDDQGSTPALFLSGKGDIARDFVASYSDAAPAGTVSLRLVPRRREPDYQHLVVTVDAASLQLRGLATIDRQGGESSLVFAKLKENTGISDTAFTFRIPRGVDVVSDDGRAN